MQNYILQRSHVAILTHPIKRTNIRNDITVHNAVQSPGIHKFFGFLSFNYTLRT